VENHVGYEQRENSEAGTENKGGKRTRHGSQIHERQNGCPRRRRGGGRELVPGGSHYAGVNEVLGECHGYVGIVQRIGQLAMRQPQT